MNGFNLGYNTLPQQNYANTDFNAMLNRGYQNPTMQQPMQQPFNVGLPSTYGQQVQQPLNQGFGGGLPDYNAQANNQISAQMQQDVTSGMNQPSSPFSISDGALKGISTGINAVQALGNTWLGFQQLRLGKQNFDFQKDSFNKNFANQANSLNTQMADRQNARSMGNPASYQSTSQYMDENRLANK